MPEYIELEATLREIERRERLMVGDKTISVDALKRFLLNRPAADVVEVVRCKDCYQSVVIGNVLHCTYWEKDTDENGYCHEGV
nr:MAG TPA: hypothetical protein [Caudoviricetes sp.]